MHFTYLNLQGGNRSSGTPKKGHRGKEGRGRGRGRDKKRNKNGMNEKKYIIT